MRSPAHARGLPPRRAWHSLINTSFGIGTKLTCDLPGVAGAVVALAPWILGAWLHQPPPLAVLCLVAVAIAQAGHLVTGVSSTIVGLSLSPCATPRSVSSSRSGIAPKRSNVSFWRNGE